MVAQSDSGSDITRAIIMGAAGRDFHNFNMLYREDPTVKIIAFTAAQIPGIDARIYPPSLAGPLYPEGIKIVGEENLAALCRDSDIDQVIFSYSDLPYAEVMHKASIALSAGVNEGGGPDFVFPGPKHTMLASKRPVIAVSAVRTGCGKSQITRWLARKLRDSGIKVAVLRHPMPYGDLARQAVQRFASRADLETANCTIEEREEYEPHLAAGVIVFAGVDYAAILKAAEAEADIILWDGGNNDFPFIRPNLHLVLVDALRPGHANTHHPGEACLRMADIIVVNKADVAAPDAVEEAIVGARAVNPDAALVTAASPVTLDDPAAVRGQRVLVIEDGPTITHGGMEYGAGYVAATACEAVEIIDPRTISTPLVEQTYRQYPHIGKVLPALGYGAEQREALRQTINKSGADIVVSATPIDLAALLDLDKPVVRARYGFAEDARSKDRGTKDNLEPLIDHFLESLP